MQLKFIDLKIDDSKIKTVPARLIEIEDDEEAKSMLKNELEKIIDTLQSELCSISQCLVELVFFLIFIGIY